MLSNKDLVLDSDPAIRRHSKKVELPLSDENRALLQDMHDYVSNSTDPQLCKEYDLSPSVGIAAIQVGHPLNMIAVVVPDEETGGLDVALANPKILSRSVKKAYLKTGEGCLSVPDGHPGYVRRAYSIKVKGYDLLTDKEVVIEAEGYPAIVLQHEIDHLFGRLYYDHINEKDPLYTEPGDIGIE